jgi:hypothetical protein
MHGEKYPMHGEKYPMHVEKYPMHVENYPIHREYYSSNKKPTLLSGFPYLKFIYRFNEKCALNSFITPASGYSTLNQ